LFSPTKPTKWTYNIYNNLAVYPDNMFRH
jgi:hypothetical protein